MSQTTTPSGADVDLMAFFDDAVKIWSDAYTGANADTIGGVTVESVKEACARIEGRLRNAREARTAVAALIARNAELEAERDALRKMWQQAEEDIKNRDAENKALRNALDLYIKAGFGNSTDFYAQSDAYNAAIRAMRGEPPVG